MKIEHVAFQLSDPVAAADWYCKHLGFTIKRGSAAPPSAYFLADATGQVMIEIYRNPKAPVPDYRAMNPLLLHLAFQVDPGQTVAAVRDRLLTAGATAEGDIVRADNGDAIAMLRDPWGFPIQFVQRAQPMV